MTVIVGLISRRSDVWLWPVCVCLHASRMRRPAEIQTHPAGYQTAVTGHTQHKPAVNYSEERDTDSSHPLALSFGDLSECELSSARPVIIITRKHNAGQFITHARAAIHAQNNSLTALITSQHTTVRRLHCCWMSTAVIYRGYIMIPWLQNSLW